MSVYRAKGRTSRRGVMYRRGRIRQNQVQSQLEAAERWNQTHLVWDDELLEQLRPKDRLMLERNTAIITKCAKCGYFKVTARKTYNKIGQAIRKIHGEYWCRLCHTGKSAKPKNPKYQEVLKTIYDAANANRLEPDGVNGRVTVRQMTEEERKQYGLPPLKGGETNA